MPQYVGYPVQFKKGVGRGYKLLSSTAAPTFNWRNANFQEMVLTANVTCVHFKDAYEGARLDVVFTQDATGGRTVTGWPVCVKWFGRTAPTIGACPNYSDLITFVYNGIYYRGIVDHDAG